MTVSMHVSVKTANVATAVAFSAAVKSVRDSDKSADEAFLVP